jgi:hypothetical protein
MRYRVAGRRHVIGRAKECGGTTDLNQGGHERPLASLIERSAELKRALVDFALSPRMERHLERFKPGSAGPDEALMEDEAIDAVDRSRFPSLPPAERQGRAGQLPGRMASAGSTDQHNQDEVRLPCSSTTGLPRPGLHLGHVAAQDLVNRLAPFPRTPVPELVLGALRATLRRLSNPSAIIPTRQEDVNVRGNFSVSAWYAT